MPDTLPRVLVARKLPHAALALFEGHAMPDVNELPRDLDPAELRARLRGAAGLVALVTTRVDGDLLDAAPGLQVVANVVVGYDNIDVTAARERGVVVTNTPDVLTGAVADFTMGLILDVVRRISEGDRLVRRGAWKGWALDFMLGRDLAGKRLGIIGAGRIGRALAGRAQAFGMDVVFASARGAAAAAAPTDAATARARLSLDELLATADIVSLHVPLASSTRHLIGQRELARMKRSAFLVNTSRGPVVDEAALAWALRERMIAGAALDVYEREPEITAELLSMDNVVLAPHLGSATTETRTAMAALAVRNACAVLAGQPPLTPVEG